MLNDTPPRPRRPGRPARRPAGRVLGPRRARRRRQGAAQAGLHPARHVHALPDPRHGPGHGPGPVEARLHRLRRRAGGRGPRLRPPVVDQRASTTRSTSRQAVLRHRAVGADHLRADDPVLGADGRGWDAGAQRAAEARTTRSSTRSGSAAPPTTPSSSTSQPRDGQFDEMRDGRATSAKQGALAVEYVDHEGAEEIGGAGEAADARARRQPRPTPLERSKQRDAPAPATLRVTVTPASMTRCFHIALRRAGRRRGPVGLPGDDLRATRRSTRTSTWTSSSGSRRRRPTRSSPTARPCVRPCRAPSRGASCGRPRTRRSSTAGRRRRLRCRHSHRGHRGASGARAGAVQHLLLRLPRLRGRRPRHHDDGQRRHGLRLRPGADATTPTTSATVPDGYIYAVIANGVRNMPSYGHEIAPADRWAIVAYIRALQRSQNATARRRARSRAGSRSTPQPERQRRRTRAVAGPPCASTTPAADRRLHRPTPWRSSLPSPLRPRRRRSRSRRAEVPVHR